MNRRKRLLLILAALLISLVLCPLIHAQRGKDIASATFSAAPYQVGERLTYNVSFSTFATAAHVELFVAGRGRFFDHEGVQLRAHVQTLDVISAALFSINTDFISYVDPSSGLPFRTEQVTREGTHTTDTSRAFNQPVAALTNPTNPTPSAMFATYDLLSALYRFRAMPLAQGAIYHLNVQMDPAQYEAEVKVTGREAVKTNVGSFNTIVTQVRVRGNERVKDYRIRIYFSDDERHVPVRVTASHPAGEIRADLASSELQAIAPPTLVATAPTAPTPTPTPKQPGGVTARPLTGLPFSAGEQLNFNFFLGTAAQSVGTASFQVRARAKYFGRDGLLLAATMQTAGAGQRLFPVNDQINSYVDATSLLPFRTELRLQEGRRRVNRTVTVIQENGSAVIDDGTSIEIPVGTHDLVSVIYALRSFDINPPKRNAVSLLVNKRPRTLFITSLKRETIELNGQRIPAVQLSLTTDEPQGDRQALRLWVSTDRRRLPLRLTAITPIGPLRGDLAIIPVTNQ